MSSLQNQQAHEWYRDFKWEQLSARTLSAPCSRESFRLEEARTLHPELRALMETIRVGKYRLRDSCQQKSFFGRLDL